MELLKWLESHPVTVSIVQWVILGFLAWGLGLLRFLKAILKQPKIEIEELTSRYFWEDLGIFDGNDDAARVSFLIEAGINNPTSLPLVVRGFTLQIKRIKKWPIWHEELNATTLPARVRHVMANATRYLKNWFSNFEDGQNHLTLDTKIDSREFQSGFLLFVCCFCGDMRPRTQGEKIIVKIKARLTTGEVLEAKSLIQSIDDPAIFESMIPGVLEHVSDRKTWNIIRK